MSAHPSLHGGSHSSFFGYGSGGISNSGPQGGAGGWNSTAGERDRAYPPSPSTARPDPPSTESESIPTFSISTILPNFLFLGPELTEPSHVEELRELGVKRILNIAAECNEDDHGLNLKERFDRYVKIPMRDTVEEENVQKGVREACEILGECSSQSPFRLKIWLVSESVYARRCKTTLSTDVCALQSRQIKICDSSHGVPNTC